MTPTDLREPTDSANVFLDGGPFDGMEVPRPSGRSLLIEVDGLHGQQVARYRQSRNRYVFRFREYDTVIARVA